ncbi:hypothetical protein LBMAG49_29190 [Planctomycetota bacterium]|nr:hypothetical protein LBMAG49_29190 [Planctomycetota bacterium]
MSHPTTVSFCVLLGASLTAALVFAWPAAAAAPKINTQANAPSAIPANTAAILAAATPTTASNQPVFTAQKPADMGSVRYPDGSKKPALNNVAQEVKLNWGVGPFTPIVRVVDGPGGWQWYVHENGAHSTTAMVEMNGVPQAMGFVAEPHDTLPVFDDSFAKTIQQQSGAAARR